MVLFIIGTCRKGDASMLQWTDGLAKEAPQTLLIQVWWALGIQLQNAMFQSRQTISFGALFVWGLLHSVFNTLNAYICVRPFARAHGEVCASCREPHKEASSLVTGPWQATTSTSGHLDHQGSSQKSIFFGARTFENICHTMSLCWFFI